MRGMTQWLAAAAFMAGLAGCAENPSSPTASRTCIPNETRVCTGQGSCQGAQSCDGTGQTWSSCDCVDLPDGAAESDGSGDREEPPPNYALIDDMEGDGNGPIRLGSGGSGQSPGYWWASISSGSASNSLAPNPFVYSALPSPHATHDGVSSQQAAHLLCTIADQYGFCNANLWFAQLDSGAVPRDGATYHAGIAATGDPDARIPYDVSAHSGIVFWGMAPKPTVLKVAIADGDTDPIAGKCGQSVGAGDRCWDSFSATVTLAEDWQRFEVKFSTLRQAGWGYRAPSGAFDPTTAYGLAFQVDGPVTAGGEPVETEVWIDDVYFE